MAISVFGAQGTEQIYQTGPESLAAEAFSIVTGPVSGYATHILSISGGDAPIALTWTVSGRVDEVRNLKGGPKVSGITFTRQERSHVIPADPDTPNWRLEYGDLQREDRVVVFFTGDPEHPTIDAIPSGQGARDLASLITDIVPIQAIAGEADQMEAWLRYLAASRSDNGRKAALRVLLSLKVPWPKLNPFVDFLMGGAGVSPQMRGYVFGIVTFAVMKGKFETHDLEAVEFLGRHFVSETNPQTALEFVLNLKTLLNFASQDATGTPLASRIADALRRRASGGPLPPAVAGQLREIHAAHPGVF